MRLPGFQAEASVYQSNALYRTAAGGTSAPDTIHPALRIGFGCMRKCLQDMGDDPFAYENCRCICYGHPGKTCWLM
jgi:hypothetical protein